MAWTHLLLAGLFEIGFALGLKHTDGFTRLWPSLGTAAAAAASLYLMTLAMRTIPVGTAYAGGTGIGGVGVAMLGIAAATGAFAIWHSPQNDPRLFATIFLALAAVAALVVPAAQRIRT